MTLTSAWTREEREAFSKDLESFCIPMPYLANEAYCPEPVAPHNQYEMHGYRDDGRRLWVMKRAGKITYGIEPMKKS